MMHAIKKILVTGARGYIGSRCVPHLMAGGYEVHAVTSGSVGAATATGITWHHFDLLDPASCVQAVEEVRPSHLLHLAWIAVPGEFWGSPSNLRWLASGIALVEAFYRCGGKRALGVGSCAEYAWGPDDCHEEKTPLRPDTIYGRCKLALGLAFAAAAAIYGGSSAWARLFAPYGPGEPIERLVPSVIDGIVNGKPVHCTLGSQIRDFIYVDDAAEALVALLDAGAEGPINIGSGAGMTLREIVAVITAQLGRAELVRFGARQRPPGDPDRVVADTGRFMREVGRQPAVGIEEGIARTIVASRQQRGA